MIHLALLIAAFLFLCWVALVCVGIAQAIWAALPKRWWFALAVMGFLLVVYQAAHS